jgi:hypothetical protein
MAYHPNASPRFIGYRGLKKEGGWGDWSLGWIVEKPCTACKKCGDSCLRVIDLGPCVWCKARSVGCSTAQRHHRGGVSKARKEDKAKSGKQKMSEIEGSEDSEGEGPSSKKVKSRSVIEDSDEGVDRIQDKEDRLKDSGEVEEAEEVQANEAEVQEKAEEDKGKRKREVKEARRVRRPERTEMMRYLIQAVRDLGEKVDRFADEVRVSNVLRNRADREYLEERR